MNLRHQRPWPANRPKKRFGPWGAVLLAALWAGPALAEENLVPNPSVEEANPDKPADPAQWQTNSWGDMAPTFRWISSGHTGERALKAQVITGSEGDSKWWSIPFPLMDAKYDYTASVWYRSNVTTMLVLRAQNDDDSQVEWLFPKETVPPSEEWAFASGSVEVPYWATRISIMLVIDQPGWVETDDYSVVAGSQSVDADVVEQDGVEWVDTQMPPGWSPPRVSIAFDDGWVSALEQAVPILETFGYTATFFVVADYVDKAGYQADYATSRQLAELQQRGHEIASHTFDHPDMTKLTSAEVKEQLQKSKSKLEELGFYVSGFAPPSGLLNEEDIPLVEAEYQYMRTITMGLNLDDTDRYHLRAVLVTNLTTLNEIRGWVEQAGQQDSWLILVYHRFSSVTDAETYVTPDHFQATVQFLSDVGARVAPMGSVLEVWTPAEPEAPVGDISLPPVIYDGSSWIAEPGYSPDSSPGSRSGGGGCQASSQPRAAAVWMLAALLAAWVVILRRRTPQANG